MKTKTILKVLFILLLCFSLSSLTAQNRREKNKKVHARIVVQRHSPHYHYAKLPKWGRVYTSVHRKALRIVNRGVNYRFYDGIYYKRVGTRYVIARAPIGVRVAKLPKKKIRCIVRGKKYYYYYGTFYVKAENSSEYETVNPPVGARIDALPEGYTEIQKDGINYYKFEGALYKEVISEGEVCYEVVEDLK